MSLQFRDQNVLEKSAAQAVLEFQTIPVSLMNENDTSEINYATVRGWLLGDSQ
jgi:hypothetical protein